MKDIITIGEDLEFDSGHIGAICISSDGTIIIFGYSLSMIPEITSWTIEDLDDICSQHYYNITGQAYLIIDAMVSLGYLSYSDKHTLYDNITRNLSSFPESLQLIGVIGNGTF